VNERRARAKQRFHTEDRLGRLHQSIGEHMLTLLDQLDDESG
jgi:hypothetical protein